eukprot:gnl/TRDRNA2_/TRDRNA2_48963_c0_seq1.p1 gnl/TRDRNA2_/TRDRNA2_48963_c0~~gnl/TRDRNA2_/TRDRNA2_48963_c0_seq1.p1  ORF type:complete len:605 (+),score=141.30 gnl/TRDRNA2_/TRDRNA2_48963_c0_seq1:187-2001(+)
MVSPLGAVEVRKDAKSLVWYIGRIVKMVDDNHMMVGFEGDVWNVQKFPLANIRKPNKKTEVEQEKFNPHVGDEVELKVEATEHAPACWAAATVRNVKHSFYFVTRLSASGHLNGTEAIVEKSMLRPTSSTTKLGGAGSSAFKTELFEIQSSLKAWSESPDAAGCFGHIEDQAGLICIQNAKDGLKLVGNARAITKAKLLLDVHIKHQGQIQKFQDQREVKLRALEERRGRIEGSGFKHHVEFKIHARFIPRIIGKSGETIRSVEEKHEVSVRIIEDDATSSEERTIRIFGNDLQRIELARGEVEFVEEILQIEPQMNSWILGRQGKTIQDFRQMSGLVYATLDRDTQELSLCGNRKAVDDAIAMFETHMLYFPVFHQMDEEMEAIINELAEYGDYGARYEWGRYKDEEDDAKMKGKGAKGGKSTGVQAVKGGEKGGKAEGRKSESRSEGKSEGKGGKSQEKNGKGGREYERERTGKGDSKGAKAAKSDEQDRGGKADSKGSQAEGKGDKGKGRKGSKGGREEESEPEDDDSDVPAARAKGGKGGKSGKGRKGSRKIDSEDSEEDQVPSGKGKGKSRDGKPGRQEEPAASGRARGAGRGMRRGRG